MTISTKLPDEVRLAIGRLINRRKGSGTVSTNRVIRELRGELGDLPYAERDLETAIARAAVNVGLQVSLDTQNIQPRT